MSSRKAKPAPQPSAFESLQSLCADTTLPLHRDALLPLRGPLHRPDCPHCGAECTHDGQRYWYAPHAAGCEEMAAAAGTREPLVPRATAFEVAPDYSLTKDEVAIRERARLVARMLSVAVPEYVRRWRAEGRTLDSVVDETHACADVVASAGDAITWPSPTPKYAEANAQAFDALARGMAGLSFAVGGVDFFGCHFESDPRWLEGTP